MFASSLEFDILAVDFFAVLRRLAIGAPVLFGIACILDGSILCLGAAVLDRTLMVETGASFWVARDRLEIELTLESKGSGPLCAATGLDSAGVRMISTVCLTGVG